MQLRIYLYGCEGVFVCVCMCVCVSFKLCNGVINDFVLIIFIVVWFSLWHISHYCLFNAKSSFYIYIKYMICKNILLIFTVK